MFYNIKINNKSYYLNPMICCSVECFLNEVDMSDSNKAVYWLPFSINLSECVDLSEEQIIEKIKIEGEKLFNLEENQNIFKAIEHGNEIKLPDVIGENGVRNEEGNKIENK